MNKVGVIECAVCDCRGHKYSPCKRATPHPMVPLRDTGFFYCPVHDGGLGDNK